MVPTSLGQQIVTEQGWSPCMIKYPRCMPRYCQSQCYCQYTCLGCWPGYRQSQCYRQYTCLGCWPGYRQSQCYCQYISPGCLQLVWLVQYLVWLQWDQWQSKYMTDKHSMKFWTFAVTLTLMYSFVLFLTCAHIFEDPDQANNQNCECLLWHDKAIKHFHKRCGL